MSDATETLDSSFETAGGYRSVAELLHDRAAGEGRRTLYEFLSSQGVPQTLSYRDTDARARAIADDLVNGRGIGRGDRVLLLYQPGLEFIEAFFGCLYAGIVAVPVAPPKPNRPLDRLSQIAANCAPAAVLTTAAATRALRRQLEGSSALQRTPIVATDDIPTTPCEASISAGVTIDSIAFLQYTSGSTGAPKGVIVTHGNILHNQRLIRGAFQHPRGACVVGWLPTFHDMGLVGNVLQTVYIGGRLVFMAPAAFLKQPMTWLQTISQHRAYTSGGPNFAYELCVSRKRDVPDLDLSGWRVAFNGAEPVRAETLERFARAFEPYGFDPRAFYPCYGLAENTLIAAGGQAGRVPAVSVWNERSLGTGRASPSSPEPARRLVSCGAVLGDQRLTIADVSTGRPCVEREIGEICLGGDSVGLGYWNDAKTTARTFAVGADGRRVLRTGDRGFIADGQLYVLGRNKEILTIFGQKYCANAVELVAENAGSDAIGRCAACTRVTDGVPELWIVCERSREDASAEPQAAVAARIAEAVTRQFDLSPHVMFVKFGALPRTSSGKLRRDVELLDWAAAPAVSLR